ncbi:hypothetical protein BH23PSE2_BH23PSE2_10430 [soil metagenome]
MPQSLIRVSLKERLTQLDPEQFAQVHRLVVVNLRSVSHVSRNENETGDIHLRGHEEVVPVSGNYLHLFRQI